MDSYSRGSDLLEGSSVSEAQRKLRVGVLGCGLIAQAAHLESCVKARNAELYAICDAADDLRQKMATFFEPRRAYQKYDELLGDSEVEAIIVATADPFHVPAAIKALEAGKHVLVEKPLGISLVECLALAEVARMHSDRIVQVGNMKRFDPGIMAARDFVQKEMGTMLALKAWYCDSTSRYTETDNLQPVIHRSKGSLKPSADPKVNRRAYYLLGHGSHLVDTARYLGGEIVSVRAKHLQRFGAFCWFIETVFANGAIGHLDLTIPVRMGWHEGFQIYGEYGSVIGKTPNPWYFRSSEVDCFSEREGTARRALGADGHVFRRQVESFADTILRGVPQAGAGLEDGIAAVRALTAISRSVEEDREVGLQDVEGEI